MKKIHIFWISFIVTILLTLIVSAFHFVIYSCDTCAESFNNFFGTQIGVYQPMTYIKIFLGFFTLSMVSVYFIGKE